MQAVFFDAIGKLRVGRTEAPKYQDDEILLKIHSAGICGTDLHILKGEYGGYFPIIPGHEFSGEVVEVGKSVKTLMPGSRVTVHPGSGYGVYTPGGFEDYASIRECDAHEIGTLTYEEGALVEPLACVVNGIDTVGVHFGDEVLIVGAGPIGLLLMQVAKLAGAQSVSIVDLAKNKLHRAKELGADEIYIAGHDFKTELLDTHPKGFHLTIDATGNPEAQQQMLGFTRSGGRFLLFGVAAPNAKMTIEPYDVFYRELSIFGVHSVGDKFEQAIAVAKSGRVNLTDIVSHHFALNQFPEALSLVRSPAASLKVLIHPGGDNRCRELSKAASQSAVEVNTAEY